MNILIGGAWVYANGSLHIGHVASLLPGDVLARYHRSIGDTVCYVSGSDCHGTPIVKKAEQTNETPESISDRYHQEFVDCYEYLGFSYDHYGKTSSATHKAFVKNFHEKLYDSEYIYEKETEEPYCAKCQRFLTDRLVLGECPYCGLLAKGDQCDHCKQILTASDLIDIRCSVCEETPIFVRSKHIYLEVSAFEDILTSYVNDHPQWRNNAIKFTRRYLEQGLKDKAITRDISLGIDVPKAGYEDKKIYIWAENVLGYLSGSKSWCEHQEITFEELWDLDSKHYYVHGKDNIPFHTIILPSLLLGHPDIYQLPTDIISCEHLTLEGKKISTSDDWAVWVKDLVHQYNPDAIRYYLLAYGPEKRDSDFTWKEFYYVNNGELLGNYGNFINRTLAFIKKRFNGVLPVGSIEPNLREEIVQLYGNTEKKIRAGQFKDSLQTIFRQIKEANRYFDEKKPWITVGTDLAACQNVLYNCVYLIGNFANLLSPFLPFTSKKVLDWLSIESTQYTELNFKGTVHIGEFDILFKRLDIDELTDAI